MYGQERVYKKVEIIGVSKNSIEDAIKSAVGTAHKTLEKLSWFEVGDISAAMWGMTAMSRSIR